MAELSKYERLKVELDAFLSSFVESTFDGIKNKLIQGNIAKSLEQLATHIKENYLENCKEEHLPLAIYVGRFIMVLSWYLEKISRMENNAEQLKLATDKINEFLNELKELEQKASSRNDGYSLIISDIKSVNDICKMFDIDPEEFHKFLQERAQKIEAEKAKAETMLKQTLVLYQILENKKLRAKILKVLFPDLKAQRIIYNQKSSLSPSDLVHISIKFYEKMKEKPFLKFLEEDCNFNEEELQWVKDKFRSLEQSVLKELSQLSQLNN